MTLAKAILNDEELFRASFSGLNSRLIIGIDVQHARVGAHRPLMERNQGPESTGIYAWQDDGVRVSLSLCEGSSRS